VERRGRSCLLSGGIKSSTEELEEKAQREARRIEALRFVLKALEVRNIVQKIFKRFKIKPGEIFV